MEKQLLNGMKICLRLHAAPPAYVFLSLFVLMFLAAADFGVSRFSDDAMDVITDPEVDAVWICSPSQYHADQIKACAANGKHVFCEKPIATCLPETVEAINAMNEAGLKLMIGLQRRFDMNFVRVKEAIEKQEVGKSFMVRYSTFLLWLTVETFGLFSHISHTVLECYLYDRSNCALATLLLPRLSM